MINFTFIADYLLHFFSRCHIITHLEKSATNRESNHGLGVCKEHYAQYYVQRINEFFLNFTTLSSHHPLIADQVLSLNQNIWTTKYHSDLLKGVLLDKGR